VDNTGYVGVGTTDPSSFLNINEKPETFATANNDSIIFDHDSTGGSSFIAFRSK
jgi:hypothetical protein